jgi:large subunit ribosomal protein L22
MTGPKLNEATFVAGERSGVKASAKYIRSSAYKARAVLDLIRGLPVRNADEVLQFTDREVSATIRKVLASAVANAQHNDELDPDTLYVKACYADEGPTLKRFRPRAKGRASRIRKRTAHITIVLGVLADDRLEVVQAREAKRTAAGRRRGAAGGNVASRRARVERSRQRAAALKQGDEGYEEQQAAEAADAEAALEAAEVDETADLIESTDESDVSEGAEAVIETESAEGGEGSASDEPQSDAGESAADAKEDN